MLNRACGDKRCEVGFPRGSHRGAVQLGVPLGNQTNSSGIRETVHQLIDASRTCGGLEIEFCDDLIENRLRPTLQLAVLFIVQELLLNVLHHISRASHVEPDDHGRWHADLTAVNGPILGPFVLRSEALDAERVWLERHWLQRP